MAAFAVAIAPSWPHGGSSIYERETGDEDTKLRDELLRALRGSTCVPPPVQNLAPGEIFGNITDCTGAVQYKYKTKPNKSAGLFFPASVNDARN